MYVSGNRMGIVFSSRYLRDNKIKQLSDTDGCACVYDPNIFLWRNEISECTDMIAPYIPFFVFGTTIITNILNVTTITRLLMEKMTGVNVEESKRRRRRWMIMFMQVCISVIQDCLQLIDIINSYYLWKLNEDLWFQFMTVTFSFLTVTAIDGFVMFICQSDIHPRWMKRLSKNNIGGSSVAVLKSGGNLSSTNFH
ncbi:CRE-SRX-131 protein [Caenorhabditis remanei]|uniref:CRE-SRX-131 protein n=1 Tax=Caenorhabditis remanei TaxID=31234 RepID=E3M0G1_CAERE|nr:CRE-SRX-131 protein [Caenorhabditis remanei]